MESSNEKNVCDLKNIYIPTYVRTDIIERKADFWENDLSEPNHSSQNLEIVSVVTFYELGTYAHITNFD